MPRCKSDLIFNHINALKTIYPNAPASTMDADTLYSKLRALENRAHRLAERECNEQVPQATSERIEKEVLDALDALLGFRAHGPRPFLNGDPRGYAIKLNDRDVKAHAIHKDWGGYGIIAPEF